MNFELWLILHKENYKGKVNNTSGYHKRLRKIYELDQKEDIKNEKVIDKILMQIDLNDVKNAILNSKKLEDDAINQDIYYQPYTKMGYFLEKVFSDLNINV